MSEGVSQARLPKLELPTFRGNLTKWIGFWEQFKVSVDKKNLNAVTKFTYLRSLLSGEAAASLTGLTLTATNYEMAIYNLKELFGWQDRIEFSYIQALLNLCVPEKPRVDALWTLYNTIQAHVRSLEALDIGGEQFGMILSPLIFSHFLQPLRMEWAREGQKYEEMLREENNFRANQGVGRDLDYLLEFLRHYSQRGKEGRRTLGNSTRLHRPARHFTLLGHHVPLQVVVSVRRTQRAARF